MALGQCDRGIQDIIKAQPNHNTNQYDLLWILKMIKCASKEPSTNNNAIYPQLATSLRIIFRLYQNKLTFNLNIINLLTGSPPWRTVTHSLAENVRQTGRLQIKISRRDQKRQIRQVAKLSWPSHSWSKLMQSKFESGTISCPDWLPSVPSNYRAPSQKHTTSCVLSYNNMERTRIRLDRHKCILPSLILHRRVLMEVATVEVTTMEEVEEDILRSVTSVTALIVVTVSAPFRTQQDKTQW